MKNIGLIFLLLISACASQEKYIAQLNDSLELTKKDLVLEWGPPSDTYILNDEVEFLIYDNNPSMSTPYAVSTSYFGYSIKYKCKTTFTLVNSVVTNWRYEGNNCKIK